MVFALEQFGVVLREDGYAHCPNPAHNDSDPSFNVFQGDDGFWRAGCLACDWGSEDVFGNVKRLADFDSFNDALLAVEDLWHKMPDEWTPHIQVEGTRVTDPSAWPAKLNDAWARAAGDEKGYLSLFAGFLTDEVDEEWRRFADAYLRQWGVGIDGEGVILIPHWTEEQQLSGIKKRRFGDKWAETGSRFVDLYGSWRGKQHDAVLLCEGESDAWWASIRDALAGGLGIDIRALPAGANTIDQHMIDQLRQWRTTYLALDADGAGIGATLHIIAELGNARTKVCKLPLDHDLRAAQPDLKQLLETAVRPPAIPGTILVNDTIMQRPPTGQNQQPRTIASWAAHPKAVLVPGDESSLLDPAFDLEIVQDDASRREVLTAGDLTSANKLRQWAGKRQLDCLLTDADTAQFHSWLLARSAVLPEVFQTERVGIHEPPARYSHVGSTLVLPRGYIGKLPWKHVARDEYGSHVRLDDAGPVSWWWLDELLRIHDPSVVHPMLAWFAATVRRHQMGNFPILFVSGPSGSGKSTLVELMTHFWGSWLKQELSNVTVFPLMRAVSATTTVPYFIDEWSAQSREDAREAMRGAITQIYSGTTIARGTQRLEVVEWKATSPIVIAGEDAFNLDRELERMVQVPITRKGQQLEPLQRLATEPVHRFGHWYNRWALDAELPPLPPMNEADRPTYNRTVLHLGWRMLHQFLDWVESNVPDPTIIPHLPAEPNFSALDIIADERENEYEMLLRDILDTTGADHLPLAWEDPDGRGVWVRFGAATSPQIMARVGIKTPGTGRSMRKYFESLGYTVTNARVNAQAGRVFASLIEGYQIKENA